MIDKYGQEKWLKDMPERIICLLLLKQAFGQEGLSSEEIEDELGGRPSKEETIPSSINCLSHNELIDAIPKRTPGGLKIIYRLNQKGMEEIGEMTDRARIELKAKYN